MSGGQKVEVARTPARPQHPGHPVRFLGRRGNRTLFSGRRFQCLSALSQLLEHFEMFY